MAQIKYKTENDEFDSTEGIIEKQKEFADKLDLYKFTADIHARIRKDIQADFTLAKLTDKDKEAVIEMTTNAYTARMLLTLLSERAYKDAYIKETKQWDEKPLTEKEKIPYDIIGQKIFDTVMTRVYMTVIMNRNVKDNSMVKGLTKYEEEDKEVKEEEEKEGGLMKMLKKLGSKSKERDGED